MNRLRQLPWLQISAEGAAIVVSILLAFWIDAWWDRSLQSGQQEVMLRSLLDDLRIKQNQLDWQRRYNEGILEAAVDLLRGFDNAKNQVDAQRMDELIGGVYWYNPSRQWESAPLSHIVGGGELSVLDDAKIIDNLNRLHIAFEDVKSMYMADEYFFRNMLVPFLVSNANLAQIASNIDSIPGVQQPYDSNVPDVSSQQDHTYLLADTDFQGVLAAKIDLQTEILVDTLPGLEKVIDDAIYMLESKLAE